MKELKEHWGKYVYGAIGGAILILILGFAVGPLTTNGSAADLAADAASDRDVAYCVANARRLVASGEASAPSSTFPRRDLARASYAGLLPDETVGNAAVRVCTRGFPQQF
jgi:hypothetical protein